MTITEFMKCNPDVKVTDDQLVSCLYLEQKGLQFLIDFGIENALELMWSDLNLY